MQLRYRGDAASIKGDRDGGDRDGAKIAMNARRMIQTSHRCHRFAPMRSDWLGKNSPRTYEASTKKFDVARASLPVPQPGTRPRWPCYSKAECSSRRWR